MTHHLGEGAALRGGVPLELGVQGGVEEERCSFHMHKHINRQDVAQIPGLGP
jgi:hypothetical protein